MLDPKYYNIYLEKIGEKIREDKVKKFLVTLLGTTGLPIRGRVLLVKETFLFLDTMKDKLLDVPDISFYPHRYGPYSRYLINKLKELQNDGVLSVDGNKISLNGNGHVVLEEVKKEYGAEQWNELIEYRIKLDQKGTDGIMKVVYEEYPEYTVNSKVKDRYISKQKHKDRV